MIKYLLFPFLLFSCNTQVKDNLAPEIGKKYTYNTPSYFGDYLLPTNNIATEEGIELGRKLFYEPLLSADNSISCASCHIQSAAFSDPGKFSDGVNGKLGTRNSMSLANLLWQKKFFWDGRASSLEQQALMPIQHPDEMNQTLAQTVSKLQSSVVYSSLFKNAFGSEVITAENIAKAIAQFERTLISSNSKFDQFLRGEIQLSASEERGRQLFFTHPIAESGLRGGNCGDCHGGNLVGNGSFHNNGLDSIFSDLGVENQSKSIYDRGVFKAPSLRNIGFTAPYMHDGRFTTLEEVLNHYNGHLKQSQTLDPLMFVSNELGAKTLKLTENEKKDIIQFLNTLNDTIFVTNPKFSKP